ncbi:MAG: allophanate hydrolase subunit 1 [Pirellulaceae bacterium]|nr:allophanate hydrolase subunit 1 [Pirellulaceae bacterium]
MTAWNHHWHGLSCCELTVERPLSPTLFRQLGRAAATIRESNLAQGAVSSYRSLAAYFSQPTSDPQHVVDLLSGVLMECLSLSSEDLNQNVTTHQVPVDYCGPDLDDVARHHSMTPDEIVDRHTAAQYVVAAVGFLPHFAYLWGLDPSIATPRKASPRVRVPSGSVGIANDQTGIYPQQSPGGWQLIGQVSEQACRELCPKFSTGDIVTFQDSRS